MAKMRLKVGTVFEGDQVRGVVLRGRRVVAQTDPYPRKRADGGLRAVADAERLLRELDLPQQPR